MANKWHVEWLREGVSKWNKRRRKVDFSPDLSGVSFFELLPEDFRDAPKTSRYFEKIDLSNSNLSRADLSNLNFYKARFDGADLSDADMSLSNFGSARFIETNLARVDARNSIFDQAMFESSVLAGSNFEGAEAEGATFVESPISRVQLESMERKSVRVFETRASYREAQISYRIDKSSSNRRQVQTVDDRTRKNKYDVFFGTNRGPVVERGALVGFDGNHGSELSYGICEVIVPEGHRVGSLGSSIFKRLLNRSDDRLRIDSLIALNKDLFFKFLRAGALKMSVRQKPTIFVHGYNNTFENAVLRAAQIGYDLGIGQGVGLFSWPSKGQYLKYKTDEASVEASKYYLADFIENFVKFTEDGGVNLIAHSMGCRCLLGALEVLSIDRKEILSSIDQIILAAADVDSAIMPRLGRAAIKSSARSTSYISDQDKALKLSGWLHSFPRVGVTPPTFVLSGMDTVLVNGLDLGDAKHGYVGTSRAVLGDIFTLLKDGSAPSERFSVEAVSVAGAEYWRIKE